MKRFRLNHDFDTLRGDIFGGVTSMVVALPVALGFGIASGMGAAAGLYGAIAVGFFASVFGGTRAQISGPTAPMTVAMAVVITSHAESLAEALTVVVLAGLLQVLRACPGSAVSWPTRLMWWYPASCPASASSSY